MNYKKQTTNNELRTMNFVQSKLNDYAKQTQFAKGQNEHNPSFNKGL